MFTARVRVGAHEATVTWVAGALDGDDLVEGLVADAVERGDRVGLEPVGPFTDAGVMPAWRALLTLRAVVDELVSAEGDEPLDAPGAILDVGEVA